MDTPRIRLLVTFDYEIFHGRNFGSDEEVLFRPTDEIFALCAELGIPAVFFPDVCSVWAHRDSGSLAYADRFEQQMREAVRRGHDVQLHLHPHWLFTSFRDGEWRLATDRIRMAELGFDDSAYATPTLLRRGVAYLEDLLRAEDPDYRCIAFRAAALALQPGEREVLRALLDAGLVIDSTVVKGVHSTTDTYLIDYRSVPAAANWYMHPRTGIGVAAPEGVLEIPVATFQQPLGRRFAFLLRRTRAVAQRRGTGMSRDARQTPLGNLWHLALMNLRYLTASPWFTLSCDTKGFDLGMVLDGFDDFLHRHAADREIVVAMINHPKLMFGPQLELLRRFVEETRRRHGPELAYSTFREEHARGGVGRAAPDGSGPGA
jgi:peptidoglycan/xylan/chitin deacetylase (PgdA/CDA1 family)